MSPLMVDGPAEPTVCLPGTAAVTGLSILSSSVKQPHGLGDLDTLGPRTCVSPPHPGDSLGLICILSPSLLSTFRHSVMDTHCAMFNARSRGWVQHQVRDDLVAKGLTQCHRDFP